VLVFISSNYGI